ncbi:MULTISPECIES: NADP-dependent malic enzyme [unclassified Bacillus (in: firmicutes)]|uniref:NAD(P)-dependent malic enzyme n=1 Tax=unclassified Bacillus (in: firmicutes) TaxID=185979 RepID=UPI001BEBA463|nr:MULTISPECIES: malic enzyme-like NAD(P)-binding protein [unclassified Bacillus (in: firmicutes)]MBT2613899.1 NAD-dependent malic enzyme [Bacillus sp. ISL-78]MBT2627778.1 NAD-dependent malic enzyme [Bacillus sp. ISL-101]
MLNFREKSLELHRVNQGKLGTEIKVQVSNSEELSLAYSPGVAEPCMEIYSDENKVYDYTMKGNMVAVITNGTAVLGLGNIGPKAALPVMEGKCILFKSFAGIDGFPICLNTTDTEQIVETIKFLAPSFGGINLEDIAAPDCFTIEDRLKKELDIPVFHDDQHGTAIVTAAGLINALKIVKKSMADIKVVVNGAGAAGIAIVKLLISFGVKDIIMCDSQGAIFKDRPNGMNDLKNEMACYTNLVNKKGQLKDVIMDTDVFIGVSKAGVLTKEMIESMNSDPIIFAMANPDPEISPVEAKVAGARIIGTGRSDYPNQVNNVLAFPGIFRGALEVRATTINEEMKIAAVYAIASLISEDELDEDYVIPSPFNEHVAPAVAAAVAEAAMQTGAATKRVDSEYVRKKTWEQSLISKKLEKV